MILVIDNFDSFTWNLIHLLETFAVKVEVVNNKVSPDQYPTNLQGILISPGPGRPAQAGFLNETIHRFANKIPLLGICLGHQALGEYFGASLVRSTKPVHGKISEITCDMSDALFTQIPGKIRVVRYHSLILAGLPACLKPTAWTDNGELMAFSHRQYPLCGIQFHPEAFLTDYGSEMIGNWIKVCQNLPVE